jgi:hypothetical protein
MQNAPRRDPIGRLSRYMKEHQLQAIVGIGRKNIHRNPVECVRLTKNVRTPDIHIYKTCQVPTA